jgi:uncharacterized OB-fold protein
MFYQCPNCKNTWQYPIEKCPNCLSKPQAVESKNLKVVGVSRVIIPSSLHPKVPYFVLLLENENGQKLVQKSIREYKIGDKYELKSVNAKNAVSIWRVKYDIAEAIEKVISLIGGIKIDGSSKILILPTIISVSHPYFRENTHPEVLNALIKFLIKKGGKNENIKVAGQSFVETPIEAMAKKSLILPVCLENNVGFMDLQKGGFKRIEKEGLVFEVSEEVFKNNLVINLPILKMDPKLGVKGALENLIRFWKKESFLGQKYLYGDEELILKLKEVLSGPAFVKATAGEAEILTVADGTIIQKSDKRATILDLMMASFNPLNLDRAFVEIAMTNLPEYLKSAKIEEIPISGREIGEVQFKIDEI